MADPEKVGHKGQQGAGSALCMSGSPAIGASKPAGSIAAPFAEEPDKLW